MPSSMASASSYWCYRCSRFVRVRPQDAIVCPDCDGGFLEEVESPPHHFHSGAEIYSRRRRRRRVPSPAAPALSGDRATAASRPRHSSDLRLRRSSTGNRFPFNPVIVLRGQSEGSSRGPNRVAATNFELYYDDGAGSGLRPLPERVSRILMASGFDRLLEQLAQFELNGIGRGNSPTSKAAVESMPTVEIADDHVGTECHCAICTDPFELGSEAREMPCKHIYHPACILPWLSMRNSCPVCRHEMPTDVAPGGEEGEQEAVGLTIWRLPGRGFAVGRFSGGRRAGEREPPTVYTEMDGEFNGVAGALRRATSQTSAGSARATRSGVIRRAIRDALSFFGLSRSSQPSSESRPSPPRSSILRLRSRSRGSSTNVNAAA